MKTVIKIFVISFLTFVLSICCFSQNKENKCKVLVPGLKGEYVGKCKRGLAHGPGIAKGKDEYEGRFRRGLPQGEGTYLWANGDIYEGDWKEGMRHGYGKMSTVIDGNDTILNGYWVDDEFIGERKNQVRYRVITRRNIDRVNFVQKSREGNTIYINFYRGGTHYPVNEYMILGSSGNEFNLGLTRGYEKVEFPFHAIIDFTAYAKLVKRLMQYKLEFEILESGTWDVFIWI